MPGAGRAVSPLSSSSEPGSTFATLTAVDVGTAVGAGTGAVVTSGTAVGAGAGTGTAVTGVSEGDDGITDELPSDEPISSPVTLTGRFAIIPSTLSSDTARASAISLSEAPVGRRFVTIIPVSDWDADLLAFDT